MGSTNVDECLDTIPVLVVDKHAGRLILLAEQHTESGPAGNIFGKDIEHTLVGIVCQGETLGWSVYVHGSQEM